MKQNELFSYVYDFISQMLENRDIFGKIRKIILYGSIVRSDFTRDSDIDLFIDIIPSANPVKINESVRKEVNKFEARAEKTLYLRGINLPLKIIVDDINKERWKHLHDELKGYAHILYGKYEGLPEQRVHKVIVNYDLKALSQKDKMSFLRKMFGYRLVKGKKEYVQKGLISEIGGEKLNPGTLLIAKESWHSVKKILNEYSLKYNLRDAWAK